MRPSDEHQHRSKKPNLFSTSRGKGGADANILARLERMPAESAAHQGGRPRVFLLAGAGVLIAGLIATLATVTRDNVAAPRRMQVSAPAMAANAAPPAPLEQLRAIIVDDAPAAATPSPAGVPADAAAAPIPAAMPAPYPIAAVERIAIAQARPATTAARLHDRAHAPLARTANARPPRRPSAAPSDDPDVAILAAILSQAPRHAPAGNGESACGVGGVPCPSAQF